MNELTYLTHPDQLVGGSTYEVLWYKQRNQYHAERTESKLVFLRMKMNNRRLLICGYGCEDKRRLGIPWHAIQRIKEIVQ